MNVCTPPVNDDVHIIPNIPIVTITKHEYMAGFILIDNPFGTSIKHYITTRGGHPIFGMTLHIDPDNKRLPFKTATSATPSA